MGLGLGNSGGASGKPRATSRTVPAATTGVITTLSRKLSSTSVFSLLAGSNANLSISSAGAISATAGIADAASQTANVREAAGSIAVEYPVTVTGLASGGADVTAPTLSAPTGTQTGQTTAMVGVTTNEAGGTLYFFVSNSATPPSAAALKAGTGAVTSGSQVVSATGSQSVNLVGLTASTTYYTHWLHRDAAANDSTIVSGSGFTTAAAAPVLGTLTLSGTLTNGTASSGTIIGATTASTITSNVTGLSVNSGARTYSWDGTGAAGTTANGLVETLAGATGSPKNNSVTVAIATTPLALGARPLQVGDSITNYAASSTAFTGNGELSYIAALDPRFDIDTVLPGDGAISSSGVYGSMLGFPGQSSSGIASTGNAFLFAELDWDAVIYSAGTNDGISNTTAADALVATATALGQSVIDAGKKFVYNSVRPGGNINIPYRNYRTYIAGKINDWITLKNAGLSTPVAFFNDLWPWYDPDGTTGAAPSSYFTTDGQLIHPSGLGAAKGARGYPTLMSALFPAGNWLLTNYNTGNMLTNGAFTGLAGTAGTGVTGTVPTGFTGAVTGGGGTTVAISTEVNADTGGNTLVLLVTPGSGTGTDTFALTSAALTTIAGNYYKAWAEVDLPALNGAALATVASATAQLSIPGGWSPSGTGEHLWLQTPSGNNALTTGSPKVSVAVTRGGAAFTMRINRIWSGNVPDPRLRWTKNNPTTNTGAPTITGTPGATNVLTIAGDTWSHLGIGGSKLLYRRYRDGVLIAAANATKTYTQTYADAGSTITGEVSGAGTEPGRTAYVAATNSIAVPDASWKYQRDWIANTGVTLGVTEADSVAGLATTRSTIAWDLAGTTKFAANALRRTSAGLLVEPSVTNYVTYSQPTATFWTATRATIGAAASGDVFLDGSSTSVRCAFTGAAGVLSHAHSGAWFHAMQAWVKGTAGQQIYLAGGPTQSNILVTFTGNWQLVKLPVLQATNSNINIRFENFDSVAGTGPATGNVTFDVFYAGSERSNVVAFTAVTHTSIIPTAGAAGIRPVETVTATVPTGATAAVLTAQDGTKTQVGVTAGGTYTVPVPGTGNTLLNYQRLKMI